MGEILKAVAIKYAVPASGVWGEVKSSVHLSISILRFYLLGMHGAGFVFCRFICFHYSSSQNHSSEHKFIVQKFRYVGNVI